LKTQSAGSAKASEQGVTRSQFLRQAVERNLRHYQNVERAIFARIYQQGTKTPLPCPEMIDASLTRELARFRRGCR
jgi:hypothetical protein